MAYRINQFQDVFFVNGEIYLLDYLYGEVRRLKKDKRDNRIQKYYSKEYEKTEQMFIDRAKTEFQDEQTIVLIPSYQCNMECEYCYEGHEKKKSGLLSCVEANEIIEFLKKSPYKHFDFILLGGEPIFGKNLMFFKKFFKKAELQDFSYGISCVSNGLEITRHIDDIIELGIKQFQLTLDGTEKIHNSRKVGKVKDKNPFKEVCDAISILIANNISVLLRINVDENNVNQLRGIHDVIKEHGWNNSGNFLAYIYPITYSGNGSNREYLSESDIFELVLLELERIPDSDRIFELDFHGIEFVKNAMNGEMFIPVKKFCASCKNQLVFDGNKHIYTCWWGANCDDFKIGDICNEGIIIYKDKEEQWYNHSVETISECRKCKYKYICGGGCVFKAHENSGRIDSGKCSDFYRNIKLYLDFLTRKNSHFCRLMNAKHQAIVEMIKKHGHIIIKAEGRSMLQAIDDGERVYISGDISCLKEGDVVLYWADCSLKLHRIISKKDDHIYTIKGDSEEYMEDVHLLDIIGKQSVGTISKYCERIIKTIENSTLEVFCKNSELMEVVVR